MINLKPKILVVEDDVNLGYLLEKILVEQKYTVTRVKTGALGFIEARKNIYDLFLIDIGLPDISGFTVIEEIRHEDKDTPIIVITDKIDKKYELESFKKRATLFHKKPLNYPLLLTQIENYLNRPNLEFICLGGLKLSGQNFSVSNSNKTINLSRSEFALLHLFMISNGRVFSRIDLMNKVMDRNKNLSDSAIDTLISRLRRKLENLDYGDFIETLHKVGYRVAEKYLENTII